MEIKLNKLTDEQIENLINEVKKAKDYDPFVLKFIDYCKNNNEITFYNFFNENATKEELLLFLKKGSGVALCIGWVLCFFLDKQTYMDKAVDFVKGQILLALHFFHNVKAENNSDVEFVYFSLTNHYIFLCKDFLEHKWKIIE